MNLALHGKKKKGIMNIIRNMQKVMSFVDDFGALWLIIFNVFLNRNLNRETILKEPVKQTCIVSPVINSCRVFGRFGT